MHLVIMKTKHIIKIKLYFKIVLSVKIKLFYSLHNYLLTKLYEINYNLIIFNPQLSSFLKKIVVSCPNYLIVQTK